MFQTLMTDHGRTPQPRRRKGLLLVAVAAVSSLLTAAVMGSGRSDSAPPHQAAAQATPYTAVASTPMPLGATLPDTGSTSVTADFPVQDPAPTF